MFRAMYRLQLHNKFPFTDDEIERIESNWVRVKGRVITSALPPQPV